MTKCLDVAAARAQGAGAAFGGQAGKQTLDAALATATTAAGVGLARDFTDGLGITHVDGIKYGGRLHLITMANQRIR
tara:strand:+ start:850 stop:1080 length:231 start_codon:yes stop_codon:yes gene_type:complete